MADYTASIRLTAEDAASGAIQRIGQTVSGLFSQLTALAGIAGGAFGFATAIKTGIEFNTVMEDTQAGIAALLLANQNYTTATGEAATSQQAMNAAMKQASEIQVQLKADALTTAASYEELTKAFQAALGPALSAGVTSIDDVRKITVGAAQAMQALSIPTHQAAQELRALFTGETGPDNRLNQVLRITREEINKVTAAGGNLTEFYMNKLRPFTEAAAAATQNFSVLMSNLKDRLGQVLGEASKPIFDTLKVQLKNADAAAAGFQQKLNEMGETIAQIVTTYGPLIQSLVQFGVVAADAGLKFFKAFEPLVPLMKLVVDGITAIVNALGPMTVAIYLGVKAWLSLSAATSALTVITSVATTGFFGLTNSILAATVASAPLAAVIGTIGAAAVVAGAAIIALKLYFVDLRAEQEKLTLSISNLKTTSLQNLDNLVAKYPEATEAAKKLSDQIQKTNVDDTAALMKLNAQVISLQRSYAKVGDSVTGSAKEADKAKKIFEQWAAANNTAINYGVELAKQQKKASEDEIKALKEKEDRFKKYIEMHSQAESAVQSLRNLQNLSSLEKIENDAREERSTIEKVNLEMSKNGVLWEDWLRIEREKERAIRDINVREKTAIAKHLYEVQGIYENHAPLFKAAMVSGFVMGMDAVAKYIPTVKQTWEGALTSAWQALAATFDKSFFSILKGDLDGLKAVFRSFGDALLGIFSKVFGDIAQRWVATKLGFVQGPGGQWQVGTGGIFAGTGSWMGTAAQFGVAGLGGYGIGSMIGGGAPQNQWGGMAGGIAGMAIAGPIGALVGAILGGAIGQLFKKSTQEWQTLTGAEIGPTGTPQGMKVWTRYGQVLGSLAGIMRTGGGKGTDLLSVMRGGEIPDEFLRSTNIKFGAGSPEDRADLFKQYLQNFFPKTLLSMAFGRRAEGYEFLPGIGANLQGIPKFTGGAGDTPLTRMLRDLGFTVKALDNIAGQIDTRDADEFIAWLNKMVGVVKGFSDLSKNLRKSVAEIYADLDEAAARPASELFKEQAGTLIDLARELDLYVGDEQLTKAGELLNLAQQYYDDQVKYLQNLRELQRSITESVDQQIRGMRMDLMSPEQRQSFLFGEIGTLMAQLQKATTPEEVRRLFGAISSNVSAIWSGGVKSDALRLQLEEILTNAQTIANRIIDEEAQKTITRNRELGDAIDRAKLLFTDLAPAIDSVSAAAGADAAALTDNAAAATNSAAALTAFSTVVESATVAIEEFQAGLGSGAAVTPHVVKVVQENNRVLLQNIRRNPALVTP